MGMLFLRTLRQLGKRLPEGVSVVGYGDVAHVALVDPPLATVQVPYTMMAHKAVNKLLAMVDSPAAALEHDVTLFSTPLIARRSMGPAPASGSPVTTPV